MSIKKKEKKKSHVCGSDWGFGTAVVKRVRFILCGDKERKLKRTVKRLTDRQREIRE